MIASRVAILLLAAAPAACGNPLGSYEVRDVKLVPAATLAKLEPDRSGGSDLLRIEFTSRTDLEEASSGHDLYVHGDFCPLKNQYRLGTFGPYYDDQPRLLSRRITSYKKSADGHVAISVESQNRHPPRDPRSGEYVYTAYLAPAEPEQQFSNAYDLQTRVGDLCLRIDSPGYYIIPSRSKIFTIKADVVQRALGSPVLRR